MLSIDKYPGNLLVFFNIYILMFEMLSIDRNIQVICWSSLIFNTY